MTDDEQWRRPAGQSGPFGPRDEMPGQAPAVPPRYAGPPRGNPPPPHWRPPVLVAPSPPRMLPAQDKDAIDAREGESRTITYGVGMVAGAILLILIVVLCGRVLF